MKLNKLFALCALSASVAAWSPVGAAATSRFFSWSIQERLRLNGDVYFTLVTHINPFLPPSQTPYEELVAPSGLVMTNDGPFNTFERLDFDTFEGLADVIFGQWQINTTSITAPFETETYHFDVTEFELSSFAFERPTILQPGNGSHLQIGKPFQIKWDPPTSSYAYGAGGVSIDGNLLEPGVLEVEVNHIISDSAKFNFSTSKSQTLTPYLSAITPPPGDAEFDFVIQGFFSRVAEITLYPKVVPEPTCSLTILIGALVMAATRSRGRHRGHSIRDTYYQVTMSQA